MPMVATIVPTAFFPLVIGDMQIAWNWVAGVILVIVLIIAHVFDWRRLRDGLGASVLAALIAMTVVYLAQCATSVTLHTLALTPERLILTIVGAVLLFPFWLSFEFMLAVLQLSFEFKFAFKLSFQLVFKILHSFLRVVCGDRHRSLASRPLIE